ncbi:hypothetical protein BZA77DRAFT_307093 [Pyronema omphalodes]|nr:hypothetical protein BZA77DRAFT_307093 [Pyronema omphalodes]
MPRAPKKTQPKPSLPSPVTNPARAHSAAQRETIFAIVKQIENSEDLLGKLAMSYDPENRRDFEQELSEMFKANAEDPNTPLPKALWNWIMQILRRQEALFPRAISVLKVRGAAKLSQRRQKQALFRNLKLEQDTDASNHFPSGLNKLYLPKLKKPLYL